MSTGPVDHTAVWELAEVFTDSVTGRRWRIEVNGLRTSTRIEPCESSPAGEDSEVERVKARAALYVFTTTAGGKLVRPHLELLYPEVRKPVLITVRSLPGQTVPESIRLRRLLKAIGRGYGFAVLGIDDAPHTRQDDAGASGGSRTAPASQDASGEGCASGNGHR